MSSYTWISFEIYCAARRLGKLIFCKRFRLAILEENWASLMLRSWTRRSSPCKKGRFAQFLPRSMTNSSIKANKNWSMVVRSSRFELAMLLTDKELQGNWPTLLFLVQDPFDLDRNTAVNCVRYQTRIREFFRLGRRYIKKNYEFNSSTWVVYIDKRATKII
uniref:Uncharacterized protein n=1 Tax=Ditylenchus dipsaci TaxID=166011 RepID=A0A915DQ67_9BILA